VDSNLYDRSFNLPAHLPNIVPLAPAPPMVPELQINSMEQNTTDQGQVLGTDYYYYYYYYK
jgi:hypothetical protein